MKVQTFDMLDYLVVILFCSVQINNIIEKNHKAKYEPRNFQVCIICVMSIFNFAIFILRTFHCCGFVFAMLLELVVSAICL